MIKGKIPYNGGWAVKGAGNEKYTKLFSTQAEAIAYAENIARNQESDTKIHGKDG